MSFYSTASEIILVNGDSRGRHHRKNDNSGVIQTSLLHCEMSDLLLSFLCVAKYIKVRFSSSVFLRENCS